MQVDNGSGGRDRHQLRHRRRQHPGRDSGHCLRQRHHRSPPSAPWAAGSTWRWPLRINGQIYLGALANFLQNSGDANVLSTPNLMTLDNEEAKIVIGNNVPFVTGSYANTGGNSGAVNPFNTVERKDVGLMLRVRPQIRRERHGEDVDLPRRYRRSTPPR